MKRIQAEKEEKKRENKRDMRIGGEEENIRRSYIWNTGVKWLWEVKVAVWNILEGQGRTMNNRNRREQRGMDVIEENLHVIESCKDMVNRSVTGCITRL
jgi:hypothetical protein